MGRKKSYDNSSILTLRLKQNHAFGNIEFDDLHALYLELSPVMKADIEQMELTFEKAVPGMGPRSAFELAMKMIMFMAINWRPK